MKTNHNTNEKPVPVGLEEMPEMLTLKEVGTYLRCSYSMAWRLVRNGKLARMQSLRRVRVPRTELELFVRKDVEQFRSEQRPGSEVASGGRVAIR
jgi:excisionase family DNA binding protein